ncbi:hypothetical protein HDV05_004056 [Chytridiales sp. JEL 0842]|nr:hypothetical protein HDV05_004056 [Chytridiales sp. JEL 0842]
MQISAILTVLALAATQVQGDARPGSHPRARNGRAAFQVINPNGAIPFTTQNFYYGEPTAKYQGQVNQRQNNYDNFVRSNIDNEQDLRNFNTEAGFDMLPVRVENMNAVQASMTVSPNEPFMIPLRWNNPHASEAEVNIWIANMTAVVPIKKPVCAGEGFQDAAMWATVPADFNSLIGRVPGFNGCNQPGDCVMQWYAHSVEPRGYAFGTPIIITNTNGTTGASLGPIDIKPAAQDVAFNLEALPSRLCLPTNDPSSNIPTAQPFQPRLVSDVAIHSYFDSNYSPSAHQQVNAISQNLQASVLLGQLASNGGELGKDNLSGAERQARNQLRNAINNRIQQNEQAMIAQIRQERAAFRNDPANRNLQPVVAGQRLAACPGCANVAATNTNQLFTTTYIPGDIYVPALEALAPRIANANFQVSYMGAVQKNTLTTMADPNQFRKQNNNGRASTQAFMSQLQQKPVPLPQNFANFKVGAPGSAATRAPAAPAAPAAAAPARNAVVAGNAAPAPATNRIPNNTHESNTDGGEDERLVPIPEPAAETAAQVLAMGIVNGQVLNYENPPPYHVVVQNGAIADPHAPGPSFVIQNQSQPIEVWFFPSDFSFFYRSVEFEDFQILRETSPKTLIRVWFMPYKENWKNLVQGVTVVRTHFAAGTAHLVIALGKR